MNKKIAPIFIIAPVRSGSTFLRLMLDSHPYISNPGECDFLFDLISDEMQFPDMDIYHKFLSLNRIYYAKNLILDKDLNYMELMYSFVEQLAHNGSALSMNVHRHFHKIPSVFPDARYIHLLRDPRDVARSCIGMGWVGNVYYGVDIWLEAERSWDKLKKKLKPNQYMEIKYEDLLAYNKDSLKIICEFHGKEYSEEMMNYSKNSTYDLPNKNLSYQWKKKYTKRELQLVEGKVSKILLERGYKLSGYEPDKAGTIERYILILQNIIYRVRHQIKKYGLFLYLKYYIANKFCLESWQNECKHRINLIDIQGLK